MLLPDGTTIEPLERLAPHLHPGKAAQPDKLIRMGATAELAKNLHAVLFLPFKEMTLEQGNELVAATWFERILAQLDDGTIHWRGGFRRLPRIDFPIPASTHL